MYGGLVMNYITAPELRELLIRENILNSVGKITMSLNDISVQITQNDIIGNALQEWLCEFLRQRDIYFRPNQGQTFPDFYFSEDDRTNLCEMKSFFSTRQPAFDVANFYGYVDSIREKPYRLNSDYLIFAYYSDAEGNISIKDIWCKKVWEITGPANDYDLKCQRKKGQIVNIRPCNWRTETGLQPFGSLEKMLAALYKTHLSTTNQVRVSKAWLDEVLNGYNEFFNTNITDAVHQHI